MAVQVQVPSMLRSRVAGARVLAAKGSTVAEVLEDLDRRHAGFKAELVEDGRPRQFVNIYLNDEDIRYLNKLDTPVKEGDVILILPAVAGGSSKNIPEALARGRTGG